MHPLCSILSLYTNSLDVNKEAPEEPNLLLSIIDLFSFLFYNCERKQMKERNKLWCHLRIRT